MSENKDAEMKKQEREQIVELGSDITKSSKGSIYTLTIIGQVEGHMIAPETVKTTKYEHVLPLLAGIEESDDVDGLLLLLNTVGGDIEAGLAIAEMIAGMKKPTVSGSMHEKELHYPDSQHDGASRADDGAGSRRTPDLPVFSADSGADCGFCHRELPHQPGGLRALYDGDGGDRHGRGNDSLRQGSGGFRPDRQAGRAE